MYQYSLEMDEYVQCGALFYDPERILEHAQQQQATSTGQNSTRTSLGIRMVAASRLRRVHLFASPECKSQLVAVILHEGNVCCAQVDIR